MTEIRVCQVCDTQFSFHPTQSRSNRGKYCSRQCMGKGQSRLIACVCRNCGKEFFLPPAEIKKGGGKACSTKCKYQSVPQIPIEIRIKENTDYSAPNGCHLWKGATNNKGYAIISMKINRKNTCCRIHRFMLEKAVGPAPERKPYACHTCHIRKCINPEHLYWGSQNDNMKDMKEAGRSTYGEYSHSAKYKEQDIITIRELYWIHHKTQTQIANLLNMPFSTIHGVISRKKWPYLPFLPCENIWTSRRKQPAAADQIPNPGNTLTIHKHRGGS